MPCKGGGREGAVLAGEGTGAHDEILGVGGGIGYWLSSSHGVEVNGSRE